MEDCLFCGNEGYIKSIEEGLPGQVCPCNEVVFEFGVLLAPVNPQLKNEITKDEILWDIADNMAGAAIKIRQRIDHITEFPEG